MEDKHSEIAANVWYKPIEEGGLAVLQGMAYYAATLGLLKAWFGHDLFYIY